MELLEREAELAAIQAVACESGIIVVEGGAGIGKTSLLTAACERAAEGGRDVLRARGSELEADFAFGVVRQLLERRIRSATTDEHEALFAGPAEAARALFFAKMDEHPARDTSFAVLHGLYWLIVNLASVRPLVICVDDAHWADHSSLRWLAYLAPRVEGLPLSLLLGLRPAEPASQAAALLAVRSAANVVCPTLLSESAVCAIVQEFMGERATKELCSAVWQKCGGNPFYLLELLRSRGVEAGPLGKAESSAVVAARGVSLSQQVAARVRRLDPTALRLAQLIAVLGDGCELRHAAVLTSVEMDTAMHLAAGLVQLEVLATDDPPRFLHPVVREAVEDSLPGDERDVAHRGAARLLHGDGAPPGRVAAHLMHVRPAGDPWVVTRLREAARAAIESGAPEAGADLLRRALAEPPPSEQRVAVLREAAAAEMLGGRVSACSRLEEAQRLVADPQERAVIGLELAEALANLYRWADAVDVCERMLAEVGEADPLLTARLEAELVVCGLREPRCAIRALPVLERLGTRRLDRACAEAYAIGRALTALLIRGRPAAEVVSLLEPVFGRAGVPADKWDIALPGLVALLFAEGFVIAQSALEAFLADVQRSGDVRGLYVTHVTLAMLKLRLGMLAEADAAARTAWRILEAADFEAQGRPLLASVLGGVAIETGDLAEAEAVLGAMSPDRLPPGVGAIDIPAVRGKLRLAQGRPEEALVEFEACQALLDARKWGMVVHDSGIHQQRSGAALALLRLGRRERALELAEAELTAARHFGAPRELGAALRVSSLARGGEAGLEFLEESVAVLRTSPALLEQAHSLVELGAALRRTGRLSAAREPLTEALDLAARCGARPLVARAREELTATGARPRREWRTGVEALTPGELRVARLAAAGKTNREIAQTLYVTLKTVEGHLARAYGKLGIEGRSELTQGLEGEKTRVLAP
ncbi:MAG TPA: AAA family ATPase [Candidatus Sulfotelmatobacter sp.]|nr:AAA family ATPase [Candidatus Sulfotelmatobacter sp.]